LARAVAHLVTTATEGDDERGLRTAVGAVLKAFDPADARTARAALRALDDASAAATGRAAQVLFLAIGALVEAGAPPEQAWPAVVRGLRATLDGATRFAKACVSAAKDDAVDRAVASAGPAVAARKPRDADAWQILRSRCLAAVACLTRSRKLRASA